MRRTSFIILLITTLFLNSCSTLQKIDSLKPEPDDASPIVYETVPSFINLPIKIKLKDIENQTNSLLNGLIYEDNTIEDDDIALKIWKTAPIKISNNGSTATNNSTTTVLPLKMEFKYRIGTKTLGIEMYDVRTFNLNGIVTLTSKVQLSNWKLNTVTTLKSIDWSESPTMTVLGKNMPITYLANPALKIFKTKIEKTIDETIEKSMDFKPNVLEALDKISTPFQINEAYESWLRINPTEIYASNAQLQGDNLIMNMGLKCTMETLIGRQPQTKFDSSKITLKAASKIPNQITANIIAVSSYNDASKIMTKNFSGQEFGSGSKKIKVQKVDLWHKDGKMIIALEMIGSINGAIYLSGFPKYDESRKEIYFDNLDYVLDTKSKIMRTANWLGQAYILKKIQQSCRYSIIPNLEEGQKTLMTYLTNYSPMHGVYVNGKTDAIRFEKIQLTNNAILASLKINGTIDITVDGLK
ncbi:hypothetical protein FFWV33_01750 [Flavobacterium faecale]|uniref:DUF4403 domain-containing protein n=1 Tax=Flavobacterium faecale TaxID=1355330 RepID=A0A2S1L9C8_9FLAO|nr:DUF4403 family protein [Flavobacterium faecale]AWG20337.1 hypothetical protein FFWV33_01750 [Flavobacterium faecale]